MVMSLHNSIQSTFRQSIKQFLQIACRSALFLFGLFEPQSVGVVDVAPISQMAEQNNSVSTLLSKYFALL